MDAPLYKRLAVASDGTKTRSRDARRGVRAALGVSSDPAPTLLQALDAAEQLRRIIDMTSGGRYGLAIVRPTFAGETGQERFVEEYTFGAQPGVIYTGLTSERSSLVHEPVTTARRREAHLRDQERAR